jgi:hypothetical protein
MQDYNIDYIRLDYIYIYHLHFLIGYYLNKFVNKHYHLDTIQTDKEVLVFFQVLVRVLEVRGLEVRGLVRVLEVRGLEVRGLEVRGLEVRGLVLVQVVKLGFWLMMLLL